MGLPVSPVIAPILRAELKRRKIQAALEYTPYGAVADLFRCLQIKPNSEDPLRFLLAGPAGTGKSRGALEFVHHCCLKFPHLRAAMLRKTRTSLTSSGIVTFEKKVLPSHPLWLDKVNFHGGDQQYNYPNESILAVRGMDKIGRFMSSEWDLVYVMEATELTQEEWEGIDSRLRNWRMPLQILVGDCNPDVPTHWLKRLSDIGTVTMLHSKHEHNPELFDQATGEITSRGRAYLARLDALTGVRKQRLRYGRWVAAEGIVFEEWDPATHLITREDPIPAEWPRFLSIDFGYTNPFVCQWWTQDPDGRLYRYREIYHTKRLVEDHAKAIKQFLQNEPRPRAIICDHDAEDRATLERHLGLRTIAAIKDVSPGVQAVSLRMRTAGDGRARVFFLRDALVERDEELSENFKPCCTEEEIPAYVWDLSANRKRGEQPLKKDDHGCDASRYFIAYVDTNAGSLGLTEFINRQIKLQEKEREQAREIKESDAPPVPAAVASSTNPPALPAPTTPKSGACRMCGSEVLQRISGNQARCAACGYQWDPRTGMGSDEQARARQKALNSTVQTDSRNTRRGG